MPTSPNSVRAQLQLTRTDCRLHLAVSGLLVYTVPGKLSEDTETTEDEEADGSDSTPKKPGSVDKGGQQVLSLNCYSDGAPRYKPPQSNHSTQQILAHQTAHRTARIQFVGQPVRQPRPGGRVLSDSMQRCQRQEEELRQEEEKEVGTRRKPKEEEKQEVQFQRALRNRVQAAVNTALQKKQDKSLLSRLVDRIASNSQMLGADTFASALPI